MPCVNKESTKALANSFFTVQQILCSRLMPSETRYSNDCLALGRYSSVMLTQPLAIKQFTNDLVASVIVIDKNHDFVHYSSDDFAL